VPVFADTNVVVYAFGRDDAKVARAEAILAGQPTVSVQVVNEFLNVCRVKLGFDVEVRHRLAKELLDGCNVVAIDTRVVAKAMEIERQAGIAYWDALIVAAGLPAGCDTLCSEDLHHGHVLQGRLSLITFLLCGTEAEIAASRGAAPFRCQPTGQDLARTFLALRPRRNG
jgi:predicted nucleic acid-binding protein